MGMEHLLRTLATLHPATRLAQRPATRARPNCRSSFILIDHYSLKRARSGAQPRHKRPLICSRPNHNPPLIRRPWPRSLVCFCCWVWWPDQVFAGASKICFQVALSSLCSRPLLWDPSCLCSLWNRPMAPHEDIRGSQPRCRSAVIHTQSMPGRVAVTGRWFSRRGYPASRAIYPIAWHCLDIVVSTLNVSDLLTLLMTIPLHDQVASLTTVLAANPRRRRPVHSSQ